MQTYFSSVLMLMAAASIVSTFMCACSPKRSVTFSPSKHQVSVEKNAGFNVKRLIRSPVSVSIQYPINSTTTHRSASVHLVQGRVRVLFDDDDASYQSLPSGSRIIDPVMLLFQPFEALHIAGPL
ncbi:hypothetical protein BDA96_04G301400 [Sorghum bicolor]|uniref:Cupin type-1 domain-containing protein n=2 Tax=Sorghum bicolor TaxID=4558 RepID=A0A921R7M5_SORBI|nr:hypothetical protein BDA96_04G301400 [Sorghum bicolor]OQU85639.1 hypothetical protein SORBI_3004G282966 [Sorghum bicolor]